MKAPVTAGATGCGASGLNPEIHALTEHASTPDRDMALRLLRHMLRIWEREKAGPGVKPGGLTPIYNLVVYHGKARWNAPRSILDMMTRRYPVSCAAPATGSPISPACGGIG